MDDSAKRISSFPFSSFLWQATVYLLLIGLSEEKRKRIRNLSVQSGPFGHEVTARMRTATRQGPVTGQWNDFPAPRSISWLSTPVPLSFVRRGHEMESRFPEALTRIRALLAKLPKERRERNLYLASNGVRVRFRSLSLSLFSLLAHNSLYSFICIGQ